MRNYLQSPIYYLLSTIHVYIIYYPLSTIHYLLSASAPCLAAPAPSGGFTLAPGVHMAAERVGEHLQMKLWTDEGTPPCEVALPFNFVSARDNAGSPIEPALRQKEGYFGPTYCFLVDWEKIAADQVVGNASTFRVSSSPIFLETDGKTSLETNAAMKVASLPKLLLSASGFWAVGDYSKAFERKKVRDTPIPFPGTADGTYAAFVRGGYGSWILQPYELASPVAVESVDVR